MNPPCFPWFNGSTSLEMPPARHMFPAQPGIAPTPRPQAAAQKLATRPGSFFVPAGFLPLRSRGWDSRGRNLGKNYGKTDRNSPKTMPKECFQDGSLMILSSDAQVSNFSDYFGSAFN